MSTASRMSVLHIQKNICVNNIFHVLRLCFKKNGNMEKTPCNVNIYIHIHTYA